MGTTRTAEGRGRIKGMGGRRTAGEGRERSGRRGGEETRRRPAGSRTATLGIAGTAGPRPRGGVWATTVGGAQRLVTTTTVAAVAADDWRRRAGKRIGGSFILL